MRNIFFFAFALAFFYSCSYDDNYLEEPIDSEIDTEDVFTDESSVLATHIAVFEVEGMMCQKGCGSILRKGLYETGGVSEVDVTFEEDNPVNQIKVYFDKNKTSIEEMISVVGTMANQQYSARLVGMSERTVDQPAL